MRWSGAVSQLSRGCQTRSVLRLGLLCFLIQTLLYGLVDATQDRAHAVLGKSVEIQELGEVVERPRAVQDPIQDGAGGNIAARADVHIIDANNSPNRGNVSSGQTNTWRYTLDLLMGSHADTTPGLPSNVSAIVERKADLHHGELRRRHADDAEAHTLEARQTTLRTAFISINTCSQPSWTASTPQIDGPPQLRLYIGRAGNQDPGPSSDGQQDVIDLEEGFAATQIEAESDTYLAVAAPAAGSDFQGSWTYDLAVSIDGYYHAANTSVPFLYLVDTDTLSALLVTDNLTQANSSDKVYQQWLALPNPLPFTVFANDINDTRRLGMAYSYCGLEAVKQIGGRQATTAANEPFLTTDMITRGLGNKPKQQFLVGNLKSSTAYNVSLALVGNGAKSGKGVVGGGGTVWQPTTWTTKLDGNCQLLYNLPFCDEVAYAAPSNPKNYNVSGLADLYDTYASQLYQNFSFSLQQISCNTTNDERYSLARNCDDCAKAYKQWLCAVTIPRCEDFSNNASYLQPRNIGQKFFQNQSALPDSVLYQPYQPMPGAPTLPGSPIDQTWISAFATRQSRNPAIIDDKIAPGPYKEVLPCEDLCYSLVQSCPAALQLSCPLPGRGLEADYGKRPDSNTVIECSYLGAVYYIDEASRGTPHLLVIIAIFAAVAFFTAS